MGTQHMASAPEWVKPGAGRRVVLIVLLGVFVVADVENVRKGGSSSWMLFIAACGIVTCFHYLSILLHEMGHAVAAWALGMRIFGVQVGVGKIAFFKKWRGTTWDLRWVPAYGSASVGYTTRRWFRIKGILMVAAGPVVSLAIILAVAYVFLGNSGISKGFPLFPHREVEVLGTIVLWTQASMLVGSVWPRRLRLYRPGQPNDGLLIFRTLFLTENEIAESLAGTYAKEGELEFNAGKVDEAFDQFSLGLRQFPTCWILHYTCGACYLAQQKYSAAVDCFVKALESPQLSSSTQTRILDSLACIPLFSGKDEFLQQADGWSLRALEVEPWSLTLKGTRGGVLVELGRIEEGRPLLEDCFKNSTSANDKSISACYFALAASKQGDTQGASNMLELARNVDPQCIVLPRITELVAGSQPVR
jgi:hypothetical protein